MTNTSTTRDPLRGKTQKYWKGTVISKEDFVLFHTYANHVMDQTQDPMKAAQFLADRGLFNGILMWVDHQKRVIHPPPVEWLKKHDIAILFEFYTNDHYAVYQAKREGFGEDLTAYNEFWCKLILDYLNGMSGLMLPPRGRISSLTMLSRRLVVAGSRVSRKTGLGKASLCEISGALLFNSIASPYVSPNNS